VKEVACVNGVFSSVEDAKVSIDDRGLQFGDGVYEVVRSYDGRLWALERHLLRLERSLRELWIKGVSIAHIRDEVVRAYAASEIPNALVYFQITRGVSPRDYAWRADITPTIIVTVRDMSKKETVHRDQGVRVITHPEIRWGRVDIKTLNLLGNMVAKKSARDAGAYESLFVAAGNRMTEGASTNLFILLGDSLVTREKGPHILPGVTREIAIECAADAGIAVEERPFTLEEMRSAQEVILTGTSFGVYSVVSLDGIPVSGGKPGAVGVRLAEAYDERVRRHDDSPR